MNRILTLLLLGVCITLAGCQSAPKVSTDYNTAYDFAGKKRLAVLDPETAMAALGKPVLGPGMNGLMSRRLTKTIEKELQARGYELVLSKQADMIVTFFVTSRNKTQVNSYNNGFGYRRCWDAYRCAAFASPQVDVKNYTEGTLFIDFIDPKEKMLEWRGVTSKRLPSKANASISERDKLAAEVVGAILAKYPPGASKN